MLHDAREVPAGARLERDLCVIGAGAAGISLALALAGGRARVALLESGGLEADPETDALSRGLVFGRPHPPLHEVRSRFLGGSTNCWHGLCAPLSPHDFEAREWVPESGWPFGEAALRPCYARARGIVGLPADGDGAAGDAAPPLPLDPAWSEPRALEIAPTRFGAVHRDALTRAGNVDLFLHANAVELRANASGSALESVRVAVLGGGSFELRARAFVLATGGIENPRLLLASNAVRPRGLGNEHDLVGRYFMEQPQLVAAAFLPARAELALARYLPRAEGAVSRVAALAPSAALLRRERLLDFEALLAGEEALPELERSLASVVRALDGGDGGPAARAWLVLASAEQAPNRASRVRLADERDALGVPRAVLEWRLSPQDLHSLRRGHELLARALGGAGAGRLQVLLGEGDMDWPDALGPGAHHLGTTRMHPDPRRGVVDAQCRVHGLANLWVAGSSVFPTSGAVAPTLTVVALALRLADHLGEVLG